MKWDELEDRKVYSFGFLVIDVCKSSKYGDVEKQQISKFLEKFVETKAEEYGGMKWHWALDGGKCGFLKECDRMAQAAEDMLIELNSERRKKNIVDFSVRICLHFGSAKWSQAPQNISGVEFSWVSKEERKIGIPDAIVITKDAFDLMENRRLKRKFIHHAKYTRERNGKTIETYIYDPLSYTNLVNIAKMCYEQNMRLDQIASQYDLRERHVRCLLETAEDIEIVTKKISVQAPHSRELEEIIKNTFDHLNMVRVIDYKGPNFKEEIAKVAADEVRKLQIQPGSSIATSCGTTIMEMARSLEVDSGYIRNVKIYPLLITMTAEMEEVSPAGIVSYLTRVFPRSKGYAAQFPNGEKDLDKARERKENYAKDCDFLLSGARNAKYMFTGLGRIGGTGVTHSFNTLIKSLNLVKTLKDDLKAVGEFCYQPFTIEGELLMDRQEIELLKANLIFVDLKEIREKIEKKEGVEIFAIAGGNEKHESILGGLRARVFNNLATDIKTAGYIVKHI